MKSNKLKNFLELNLSVLLISTAGTLVRYVQMDPILIAFWRGLIAAILLGSFAYFNKASFKIGSNKDKAQLLLASVFFAGHWVTYFYALHVSNVAVGMLSLFTFPAITTLLEPLYFKTKFNKRHLILASMVLIGLYIMAPEIDFSHSTTQGIFFGVISAILYAVRNLMMKSITKKYDSSAVMFYQFLFLIVIFIPFLTKENTIQAYSYAPYLLCLGIFTTAIGHTLFVRSFSNFNVSTSSIISTMQPVFGIVMGFFFLSEIPNLYTLIGGLIIISTVVIESFSLRKK